MPSTRVRLNTLRSRLSACADQLRPRRIQAPEKWREVCLLMLDLDIVTSHVQELKYRELIMAQHPRVKLKRPTPCLVDIDGCEANVRNLERALRKTSSTTKAKGGTPWIH